VVDPLIMMDRYGTDAFRFTLAAFAAQGRDIRFSENRVEGYRHFVNKLWNAARFIMMNVEGSSNLGTVTREGLNISLPDKWILSRLSAAAEDMNTSLKEYRFNDAANSIYQFIWHEFCDWYIEMAKIEFRGPELELGVKWCLLYTLDTLLRLLHPFMPFVTEEIWQKIKPLSAGIMKQSESKESIMISEYPKSLSRDSEAEDNMSYIIDAVTGIRTIRGELNISPSVKLNASIKALTPAAEIILRENVHYIKSLARADEIEIGSDIKKPGGSATSIRSSTEIFIPLKGVLNIAAEMDRLKKDKAKVDTSLVNLGKKLFNDDFLQKAPREIIEKEKVKYDELMIMRDKITEGIKMLREAEVKNDA
jgi:valyl-tRNA synthetase